MPRNRVIQKPRTTGARYSKSELRRMAISAPFKVAEHLEDLYQTQKRVDALYWQMVERLTAAQETVLKLRNEVSELKARLAKEKA